MDYKTKSRANLKKSLYFGGSIALGTGVVGAAVAIPTYLSIQKDLKESLHSLSDLSEFMHQLADKLGVSSNTEFAQNLADGYEVSYSNGKTNIFKTVDGTRTLVMNMNPDGTVGSAASMTGLAAQKMLSVISEAKDTLGEDMKAMDDILGPFVEQTKETSATIESAMTGLTKDEIKARNMLAVAEADKAAAAEAVKNSGLKVDITKIKGIVAKTKAEQDSLEAMEGDDSALQAEILKEQEEAKKTEAIRVDRFKNAYVAFMISDTVVNRYQESEKDSLLLKTVQELRMLFEKLQSDIAQVKVSEAEKIKTDQQLTHATSGGHSSIISKILSNPASFANVMIASFGYENGTETKKQNTQIRRLFWNELSNSGVTEDTYGNLIKYFGNVILGIKTDLSNWKSFGNIAERPNKKASFEEMVNTYGDANQEIKNILVLSVEITDETGATEEGYVVGKSSNSNILDPSTTSSVIPSLPISYPTSSSTKDSVTASRNTLDLMVWAIKSDIMPDVRTEALRVLNDFIIKHSSLPPLRTKGAFDKLVKLVDYVNDLHNTKWKSALALKMLVTLGDEILIKGYDIDFDSQKLIDSINLAFVLDSTSDEAIITKTPTDIYSSTNTKDKYINQILNSLKSTVTNDERTKLFNKLSNVYRHAVVSLDGNALILPKALTEVMKPSNAKVFDDIIETDNIALIKGMASHKANAVTLFNSLVKDMDAFDTAVIASKGTKPITEAVLNDHISQLFAIKDQIAWDKFMTNNISFTLIALLSQKADITYAFKDANQIVSLGNGFDLSTKDNIDKVTAASGVSKALKDQNIAQADADDIKGSMMSILATSGLTTTEFNSVVEYTDTIFKVVPDTDAGKVQAINRLKIVLDKNSIKSNMAKIIKFNQWVKDIKKSKGGTGTITKAEIEKFVWTAAPGFTTVPTIAGAGDTPFTGFTMFNSKIYATVHADGKLMKIDDSDTAHLITQFGPDLSATAGTWFSGPATVTINGTTYIMSVDLKGTKLFIWDLSKPTEAPKELDIAGAEAVAGGNHIRTIGIIEVGNIHKIILLSDTGQMLHLTGSIESRIDGTETTYTFIATPGTGPIEAVKTDGTKTVANIMGGTTYVDTNGDTHMIGIDSVEPHNILHDWNISLLMRNLSSSSKVQAITSTSIVYTDDTGAKVVPNILNLITGPRITAGSETHLYAYAVGLNGELIRMDLDHLADVGSVKGLLNLHDLKDKDGNILLPRVNSVGTATDKIIVRGINYDAAQTGPTGRQIAIIGKNDGAAKYISLHDNSKDIDEIFNFLIP